jgi:Ser/Thr protein kinase RdoA (MazF antagonist)
MLLSEANDGGLHAAYTAWLGGRAVVVEPLTVDAFSGSLVVRVRTGDPEGDLVLKSFAATARPRIAWVHGLMGHLRASGCREVPGVVAARCGDTIVTAADGSAWEAVRFVPGTSTDDPSATQARAAAATVARLHMAAATWPMARPRVGVASAVTRRIDQAARMLEMPWDALAACQGAGTSLDEALAARVAEAAVVAREAGLEAALRRVASERGATAFLQPVLRDIWSSHVLFATDEPARVAGVIDFHAAAIDTPATDVARLLGSWPRGPLTSLETAWRDALAAYEAVRPLNAEERRLVPWLDATATIFGLDNWFRWILVEGRRFERSESVVERVDRLVCRLPEAVGWLNAPRAAV